MSKCERCGYDTTIDSAHVCVSQPRNVAAGLSDYDLRQLGIDPKETRPLIDWTKVRLPLPPVPEEKG